jgi:DNA-binding transcriptional MocR family regulator
MSDSKKSTMSLASVLWTIRDAQSTRGADRELLYALALRCAPDKRFVCYPSYDKLSKDTKLNVVTLKRAAARLEAAGYISRTIRPNHSNLFYLNMGKLKAEAAVVRAADAEAKKAKLQAELVAAPFPFPDEDDVDTDIEAANAEYNDDDLGGLYGGGK